VSSVRVLRPGADSGEPGQFTAASVELSLIFDPITASRLAALGYYIAAWWPVVDPEVAR